MVANNIIFIEMYVHKVGFKKVDCDYEFITITNGTVTCNYK